MILNINGKIVSNWHRPFLVAEIGINHNGSLSLAKKTIIAAKESGADAVKFQFFRKGFLINPYLKESTPVIKILEKNALTEKMIRDIKLFCDKIGILFFATVFDLKGVDILESLNVSLYKIASGDINNLSLIEKVAKTKKPVVLSTGASILKEVDRAVSILKKYKTKFCLLHCVSLYPAPLEKMNLKTISFFFKRYKMPSGLSDHTVGIKASEWAVSLGAAMIEKHFTLNRSLKGPDHKLSLDPEGFSSLCKTVELMFKTFGEEKKSVLNEELQSHMWGRRSPVAIKKINKSERISDENVILLRPQKGLSAEYLKNIIGKKAKIDIPEGTIFNKENIYKNLSF